MRKVLLLLATMAALAAPVAAQASATTERVPFEADVIACNGDVTASLDNFSSTC